MHISLKTIKEMAVFHYYKVPLPQPHNALSRPAASTGANIFGLHNAAPDVLRGLPGSVRLTRPVNGNTLASMYISAPPRNIRYNKPLGSVVELTAALNALSSPRTIGSAFVGALENENVGDDNNPYQFDFLDLGGMRKLDDNATLYQEKIKNNGACFRNDFSIV